MVGFTPVEEVEDLLVVPKDGVVKEVRVFFREELVEEQSVDTVLMEDLLVAEVLVVQLWREEVVVVEGTLVEAVGVMMKTPVGEECKWNSTNLVSNLKWPHVFHVLRNI